MSARLLQKDFQVLYMPVNDGVVVVALVTFRADADVVHEDCRQFLSVLDRQAAKRRIHKALEKSRPLLGTKEQNCRSEDSSPAYQL